jgi:hypothetical protein
MNSHLQKLFTKLYSPDQTKNSEHGASSVQDTVDLRQRIENLFVQYNIKSMFDAGCNDCEWMSRLVGNTHVAYQGGDISLAMVAHAWRTRPELDVQVHDATTDPFPVVDLLFVRDVAIHLNNADKKKLWQNWLDSNIPWILITHNLESKHNSDFEYTNEFPFAMINWQIDPWNFPAPVGQVWEYEINGRCMSLWNQNQFKGKI